MKKSFKKTFSLTILILVIGVTFTMNLLVILPSQAAAGHENYDWVTVDPPNVEHCEASTDSHCGPGSSYQFLPI